MPSDLQITNIKDQANANSAITIASDGQITVNQNNPTVTLGSNATFPAGHVIQFVTPSVVVETNALTTSYVNLHEVSITLKGGSSKILILHEFNWYEAQGSGIGQKVYKKTSATVTTSDTLVFDKGTGDSNGPLHYYGGNTSFYFTSHHHFVDDASSHNAGDTIYYGFFYRIRSGTATLPPDNSPDGYFKTNLLEISG